MVNKWSDVEESIRSNVLAWMEWWHDVTWVFLRELKDEVSLPDYNVFQEINSPAIQLILPNPCGHGGG